MARGSALGSAAGMGPGASGVPPQRGFGGGAWRWDFGGLGVGFDGLGWVLEEMI